MYNKIPNKNYRDEFTEKLNVEKKETPLGFSTMRAAGQNVPKSLRKKLKRLWEQVVYKDKLNGKWSIYLGSVDEKVKNEVKKICGKDVTRQTITINDIRHIYTRHGKNIAKELADGQIPVTKDIFALIPDVLINPDNVRTGGKTKGREYDTKEYADGTVHTVTAIVNDNTLKVHTVYVWDKEKTKKQALGANRTVSSPTVFRHNA